MRNLYNELFYVPKHGKVRDKVMLVRVVVTTVIMVACLAAMSMTAYAFFSYNVSSNANVIKAAGFTASVSIVDAQSTDIRVTVGAATAHTANLPAGRYTVTLEAAEGSTASTGFCTLTVGDTIYHTQQIGADSAVAGGKTEKITFTLQVPVQSTVTVLPCWGTSSYYADFKAQGDTEMLYITDGETVAVPAPDIVSSATTAGTTAATTVPSTSEATQTEMTAATTKTETTTASVTTVSIQAERSITQTATANSTTAYDDKTAS